MNRRPVGGETETSSSTRGLQSQCDSPSPPSATPTSNRGKAARKGRKLRRQSKSYRSRTFHHAAPHFPDRPNYPGAPETKPDPAMHELRSAILSVLRYPSPGLRSPGMGLASCPRVRKVLENQIAVRILVLVFNMTNREHKNTDAYKHCFFTERVRIVC